MFFSGIKWFVPAAIVRNGRDRSVRRRRAFRMCHIYFILCAPLLFSCATYVIDDRIMAENKAGRNRIGLLDRENHVLKKENADLLQNVRDRDAKIDRLSSELASLQQQYKLDISLLNTQIELQRKRQEASDRAYEEKIKIVSAQNVDLDRKLSDMTRIADETRMKAEDLARQNERIKTDSAKHDADMTIEILSLRDQLSAKDKESDNSASEIKKLLDDITSLKLEIETLKSQIPRSEKKSEPVPQTPPESSPQSPPVK
jgi:hypothetical protein